jgi:hypothetical protein
MSLPLQVIEGIFSEHDGVHSVSRAGEADIDISELLTKHLEKVVEINLHHFPFSLNKAAPGGGSCLWHGFCPHGHREHPGWLFHQKLSGVLTLTDSQGWEVGGVPLDLAKMPGHQGRLVLLDLAALDEPEMDDTQSPDDLIREAEAMVSLLSGLQKAVKT